jgi:hypothetical protein
MNQAKSGAIELKGDIANENGGITIGCFMHGIQVSVYNKLHLY